jgi:4-hydroxy-4-methyl-2-oxoglutarate aldolase
MTVLSPHRSRRNHPRRCSAARRLCARQGEGVFGRDPARGGWKNRRAAGAHQTHGALLSIVRPAVTVQSPPGDNLWLHRALYEAQPGDVLVVTVAGQYDHGYWGEVMSTAAKARNLGGLVIDACVRDGVLLEQIGFPVFARGLCIRGTGKDFAAPGWINYPILLGSVVVNAGDLMVGDGDGVVAIPAARIDALLATAAQRDREEAAILKRLAAGERTLDIYGWS